MLGMVPERGNERLLKGGNCQVTKQQTCRARATDRFFTFTLKPAILSMALDAQTTVTISKIIW